MIDAMKLLDRIASHVPHKEHVFISITGGGGKSSLMRALAAFYRAEGKRVLMTTSTKIQSPEFFDWGADYCFTSFSEVSAFEFERGCTVLYACSMEDDIRKLKAPISEELLALKQKYDVTICEADGSRHLPLKIHTQRDPVIYGFSDFTIAVMGAWAYGKEAREVTFGYEEKGIVDKAFLNTYISCPEGLLKGNPDMILVNGIDGGLSPEPFKELSWPQNIKVIGGSLVENTVAFEI